MPDNQVIEHEFIDITRNDEVEAITRFMDEAVRSFNASDYEAHRALSHPSTSELGERNTREFITGLMKSGHRIVRWTARPFVEPKWPVFRKMMLSPAPVFWIDVFLNDGHRRKDYELFFALPAIENEPFKMSTYADRPKPPTRRSSPSRVNGA
jgi:hypothetical protein